MNMAQHRVVFRIFKFRLKQALAGNNRGWCWNVKELLEKYNLMKWWRQLTDFPEEKEWSTIIQKAVSNREQRVWSAGVQEKSTLVLYKSLKSEIVFEDYLKCEPWERAGRSLISKLRGGTNALRVSMERQFPKPIPRHMRHCIICNSGMIEDEYHFLIELTS